MTLFCFGGACRLEAEMRRLHRRGPVQLWLGQTLRCRLGFETAHARQYRDKNHASIWFHEPHYQLKFPLDATSAQFSLSYSSRAFWSQLRHGHLWLSRSSAFLIVPQSSRIKSLNIAWLQETPQLSADSFQLVSAHSFPPTFGNTTLYTCDTHELSIWEHDIILIDQYTFPHGSDR